MINLIPRPLPITLFIFTMTFCLSTSLFAIDAVRIMPCGDSITYDNFSGDTRPASMRTGYRSHLWYSLQNAGYYVDFVGSVVAGEAVVPAFDPDNEGHSGWRDDQIADYIYGWLQSNPADIILLHIGTNALSTSPDDVNDILDEVDRYENNYSTHITVILAKIINRTTYSADTTTFNTNVSNMAQVRINNGDDIIIVDMENGAGINYSTDMQDYLHPNDAGYQKMANLWFSTLQSLLPDNLPLYARINSPDDDSTAFYGEDVTLSGSAYYGTLPYTSYEWSSDVDGYLGTGEQIIVSDLSVHKVGNSIEPHTITLTVEDSNCDIETAQIDLTMLFKGDFEPHVFNTGVDANGDALGDEVLDSHWTLTSSPDTTYNGPETYTVKSNEFPIPPWLANTSDSMWICPRQDATQVDPGTYVYQLEFDLTSYDPDSAEINGQYASDDSLSNVKINGVSTGINGVMFDTWHSFSISSGFAAGINTLEFLVGNGSSSPNPSGLRVEQTLTVNPLPPKASNPGPADNATGVSVDADLSWWAGYGAASHDLYFGTDFNDVNEGMRLAVDIDGDKIVGLSDVEAMGHQIAGLPAGPYPADLDNDNDVDLIDYAIFAEDYLQECSDPAFIGTFINNQYSPGTLESNTTYYWRVDERAPNSITRGDIWRFTTSPP